MRVLSLMAAMAICATPALAQSEKESSCRIQGELMGLIQQARLDGVRQANLTETVAAARPDFSEKLLQTVPNLGSFVYDQRRRDLRKLDLAALTEQQCLDNWEQIQALRGAVSN